jgi:hypothetical protein
VAPGRGFDDPRRGRRPDASAEERLRQGLSNPRVPSLPGRRHFRTIQIRPKDLRTGSVAG